MSNRGKRRPKDRPRKRGRKRKTKMQKCVTINCKWRGPLTVQQTGLDQQNRPVCGLCQQLATTVQKVAAPNEPEHEPPNYAGEDAPPDHRAQDEGDTDPEEPDEEEDELDDEDDESEDEGHEDSGFIMCVERHG